MPSTHVIPFGELALTDLPRVGGKNASLGELIANLTPLGVRIPPGFAVTAEAFRQHLGQRHLDTEIEGMLAGLDIRDNAKLATVARDVRERIRRQPLDPELERAILTAYGALSREFGEDETDVAVRSSATAEDLPTASFAGQHESYLNVRGRTALLDAVRDCMASLYTDRAIVYRTEHGFRHRDVALSVGVQKMVRSDLASAGVIFTLDPDSGFRDVVVITGSWGLGETVVQGRVNPDELWVHKPTLAQGHRSIVRRERGDKRMKLIYAEGGVRAVAEVKVSALDRHRFVLSDDEVLQLARWAVLIETHYSTQAKKPTPMDIEWAKDGRTGELYVVQARPESVHSQRSPSAKLETFRMKGGGKVLVRGKAVGARVGTGKVRVITGKADLSAFCAGEILVAQMTDPDWEPIMRKAAAIITDQGGRTCHAAIVAREAGLPCVVGTNNASQTLTTGMEVTVTCANGEEGLVYEGVVPFVREQLDVTNLGAPKVPVMLNVGNPDQAFALAQLPSAGVGLARIEFIVSSWIGVHPMALLHPERVVDAAVRGEVLARARDFASPPAFFVERLATGLASIAAAFYPRPVVARFSDFKTNEYAGLLGGKDFEPLEANPMLGFRGASRYYDPRYREAFGLECAAVRRCREDMGLINLRVMVPFCRTPDEARRVLSEMARHGLIRGEQGLEVWMMCEIPSNVILADEFSQLFDGFSIGSNDLTQLTLGVDRDSPLLAHLFDERSPAVEHLIASVVRIAHAHGRKVGLCGQAPSDHPEFVAFLARIDIDSISVTPDALVAVMRQLGDKAAVSGH